MPLVATVSNVGCAIVRCSLLRAITSVRRSANHSAKMRSAYQLLQGSCIAGAASSRSLGNRVVARKHARRPHHWCLQFMKDVPRLDRAPNAARAYMPPTSQAKEIYWERFIMTFHEQAV